MTEKEELVQACKEILSEEVVEGMLKARIGLSRILNVAALDIFIRTLEFNPSNKVYKAIEVIKDKLIRLGY